MKNRIYAMDTHFKCDNQGPSVKEQALMVKDAGYDDYYVTGAVESQEQFKETLKAAAEAGLGFNAAFQRFDVSKAPEPQDLMDIESVVSKLPAGARFEISMTCGAWAENVGNLDCDEKALPWLRSIASILEKYGIEASLYPHFGFYLETFTDALRLAKAIDHPLVKVIFCGYHWYNVGKEQSFADLFAAAGNRLNAVNLCGSRHLEDASLVVNGLNPSIEPLDTGTLPNAAIIAELHRIGFTGPIGVQGYGVNAPASEALKRSRSFLSLSRKTEDKSGDD